MRSAWVENVLPVSHAPVEHHHRARFADCLMVTLPATLFAAVWWEVGAKFKLPAYFKDFLRHFVAQPTQYYKAIWWAAR